MKNKDAKTGHRIAALDLIRGIAVLLMIIYHTVFAFGGFFDIWFFKALFFSLLNIAPVIIASLFILTCAFSSYLSRSNGKRGLITLGAAILIYVTTAVFLPKIGLSGLVIKFGILHFLSIAMLLTPPLMFIVKKIPAYIGIPVCLVLFFLTFNISDGYLGLPNVFSIKLADSIINSRWLFPLGIHSDDFFSADYYPLFPWIFLYVSGLWPGRIFRGRKIPEKAYEPICKSVEFIGKKALLIYLVHMPIIFLIGYLISSVKN
ncbi:MAG TPA: heparan-alpha-glucosaminide N-acetyltransferase [Clostridiales bacterium]|nr:heparan-alpha-glucosaminide N-acetyltransferase [Clostridiales bacterium]